MACSDGRSSLLYALFVLGSFFFPPDIFLLYNTSPDLALEIYASLSLSA
jgi:hypothetical protein